MTQKLYIPIGIPASGKTTYWNEHFDKEQVLRLSRDDINAMLSGTVYTQNINNVIKDAENIILESVLEAGFSIFIDRVNLTPKSRKRFINKAKSIKPKLYVVGLFFKPDLKEAVLRNDSRTDKTLDQREKLEEFIPEAKRILTEPSFDESFDEIHFINPDGTTDRVEKIRELDKKNELQVS
jgi:predicted kinase